LDSKYGQQNERKASHVAPPFAVFDSTHRRLVEPNALQLRGQRTQPVIGSTNRLGEHAQDRPVHYQEIFATLYRNLGIDVDSTRLIDLAGRPQFLSEHPPIRELV
jgi:hypothetical protein